MKKYLYLLFIIVVFLSGCSLFDTAKETIHSEGTIKFFATGFNPYEATFANAGSPYGPGTPGFKLTSLPTPDILELTITQISLSQDNKVWRNLLNRDYKVDIYSRDAKNYIKGVEIGGYQTIPAGTYPYCKIYISEILIAKQNVSIDSLHETAEHYGPPINPLTFSPDNSPAIKVIAGINNKVFFNSFFDYVLTETEVNGNYTLSGSPHYQLNPEYTDSSARITGVLYWTDNKNVLLTSSKYVALYKNKEDYINNNPPQYGTFADYKGNFSFKSVAEGIYYIGAFIDINSNGTYEPALDYGMSSGPELIEIKNGQNYPVTLKAEFNDSPAASTLSASVISSTTVKLSWTGIPDKDFARFEIYQADFEYENIEKQTLVYTSLTSEAGNVEISGLVPETEYYFTIWSIDYSGATTKSKSVVIKTLSEIEVVQTYPLVFKPFGITFSRNNEPVITAKDTPKEKIVPDVIEPKYIYRMLSSDYSVVGETIEAPGPSPTGITFLSYHYVLTDSSEGKFYYLDSQLTYESHVETPNGTPVGVDYNSSNGKLYSCDITECKGYEHNTDYPLTVLKSWDYQMYYPAYPAITDIAFVGGTMWSCDSSNRKIYRHRPGRFEIDGEFSFDGVPTGIVYFSSHLYVADHENNRIVKLRLNN